MVQLERDMAAKVLIVSDSFEQQYGGWGTVAHYLAKVLEESGNTQVTRLSMEEVARARGGRFSLFRDAWDALRWRSYFRGQDLVVCVCEPLIPLCAYHRLVSPRSRLVILGMGTYAYYPFVKGLRKYVFRALARQADAFFVISRFTEKKVREWWGPRELGLLQLGVDTKKNRRVEPAILGKTFLFVGAQKERKGVSYLLEAFRRLLSTHPDAVLELVGTPSPHYCALAKEKGISDRVHFLGPLTDTELSVRYSRARCHVLPSVNVDGAFEGFGLSHLEANAFGIPSIGSTETANDEVIVDGKTGFLCRQKDPADLHEKMLRVLEDPDLYQTFERETLKHAENLDWFKVLPEFWDNVRNQRV